MLVSVVGTLGNACIMQKRIYQQFLVVKVRSSVQKKINPVILLTYLNCKYRRELLLRKERGTIQKGLNLDDFKTLIIPEFDATFSNEIERMFYEAQNCLVDSKSLYSEAEEILLTELGLKNWQTGSKAVNVKTLKESFLRTGRLDAEYYQPNYDKLKEKLSAHECMALGDIVSIKRSPLSRGARAIRRAAFRSSASRT